MVLIMKLTDELKDKIDSVESNEVKETNISEEGIELDDNKLEDISGGAAIDMHGLPSQLKPEVHEII